MNDGSHSNLEMKETTGGVSQGNPRDETILLKILLALHGTKEGLEFQKNTECLTRKWDSRGLGARSATTTAYQEAQRRLLIFLAVQEDRRFLLFSKAATSLNWSAETQDHHWQAIHSAAQILNISTGGEIKQTSKFLRVQATKATTWRPEEKQEDSLQFFEARHCARLEQYTKTLETHQVIYVEPSIISFYLGQRTGDTIKWRTKEIRNVEFPKLPTCVAITVLDGKTVERMGPYTLFAPLDSKIARIILERRVSARAMGSFYLFLNSPTELNKQDLEKETQRFERQTHRLLKAGGLEMDLRATRRGGLSLQMMLGYDTSTVRTMSQHASDKMLKTYLANDLFNAAIARSHLDIVSDVEELVNNWSAGTRKEF